MDTATSLQPKAPASVVSDLREAERQAYRERGYFVRPALFTERELAKLRAAVEEIHQRMLAASSTAELERIEGMRFQDLLGSRVKWEWKESMAEIRSMEPVFHLSPAVDALIDDERICSPVRGLLDSPISLFTDKLNFKRPSGAPFPWHQDAPYWAFECKHIEKLVSVQIYLDDATEENGCLWMIPGSHTRGHVPPPKDRGDGKLARLFSDVREIEELPREPIIAPAGSAIFFDAWVVHGSKSNRSASSRRAVILTYQPENLPLRGAQIVRSPRRRRLGATGLARGFLGMLGYKRG